MGVPVHIEAMSLGWRKGVRITGVRIASPAEFGDVPLLTAEELSLPMAPIDLIFRDRLDWIRVHKPVLNIVVNESGDSNLSVLSNMERNVEFDHLLVENATARVDIAALDNELVLGVDRLEFRSGQLERIASVSMAARLHQQRSHAPITLSVDSGTDMNTATRATFTFDDISLADLSLPMLLDLPYDQLDGTVTGSLDIYVSRQGAIERSILTLDGEDIVITPEGEAPLEPFHAIHILAEAAYDPISSSDIIDVSDLTITVDEVLAIRGGGTISTDLLAGDMQAVDQLNLSGYVDPAALRACVVARSAQDADATIISGRVNIDELRVNREGNTTTARAVIDASLASIRQNSHVLKPAGRELTFEIDAAYNDLTDRLRIAELAASLGANRITASGTIGQFPRWVTEKGLSASQWLALLEQADAEGRALLSDMEAIRQMTPHLAGLWDDLSIENLSDDSTAPQRIRVDWSLFAQDGQRFLLTASLPGRATVTLGRSFVKPPNQPAALMVSGVINGRMGQLDDVDIDVSIGRGQLLLSNGQMRWSASESAKMTVTGDFTASGIDGLLLCHRDTPTFIYGPIGQVRGDLTMRVAPGGVSGSLDCREVDLTGELAAGGEGSIYGQMAIGWEARGQEVRLAVDATALAGQWTHAAQRYQKRAGEALVMETELLLDEAGDVFLRGDMHLVFGQSEVELKRALGEPTRFAGRLVLDDALLAAWPDLAEDVDRLGLSGYVDVDGGYVTRLAGTEINLNLDGEELAWDWDGDLAKPAGVPADAALTVTTHADQPGVAVAIHEATLGPASVSGTLSYRSPVEGTEGLVSQGLLDVSVDDAAELMVLCPMLSGLSGGARVQLEWLLGKDRLYLGQRSAFDGFQAEVRGRDVVLAGSIASEVTLVRNATEGVPPLLLAGEIQHEQYGPMTIILGSLMTDGLAFDIGGARGYLVADVSQTPEQLTGTIHLLAETIDTQDLVTWLTGEPLAGPEEFTLTEAEVAALDRQAQAWVDLLAATLPQAELTVYADIDRLLSFDTMVEETYELSNMAMTLRVDHGQVVMEYAGGLSSGTLNRRYTTDLNADSPELHFVHNMRDVVATPNVAKQIEWTFPDNHVTGLFNHHEDLIMSLQAGLANGADWRFPTYATGDAETLALRGVTRGQAAPDFITNVFPGLETAEYAYEEMSAQAIYQADGVVVNDVVFSGRSYDMYMEGTTNADHVADYEIGIILLSEPQTPEWNHLYRQGRIPVLNFKGRIEWGQFVDVNVTYPWPTETLYSVFLKNNYFYRLWVVDQKRGAIQRTETVLPPAIDEKEPAPRVTP